MHYTMLNSVGPANVVSDYAKGGFIIRSYSYSYLRNLEERFINVIKGAALMTGTTYTIHKDVEYMPKVPVFKLNDLLMENAKIVHATNIKPPIEQSGSTDFATVPGSVIRVAFAPEEASVHSKEFLLAGKSEAANNAIIIAGKIIAATCYELISDSKLMDEIKSEFKINKEKMNNI